MLKTFTDVITILGVAGIALLFAYLAKLASGYVKSKADATEDAQKKNELEKLSNGLNLLSKVATSQVTYLDRFNDGGQSKKAAAIGHLTEVANEHGLNVSPTTIDGLVENALNNLRDKQGLPLPNSTTQVEPAKQPAQAPVAPVEQQAYVSDDVDTGQVKQSAPYQPGDVKYEN